MSFEIKVQGPGACQSFMCAQGERLLHAGLRTGIDLPYGCGTGTCGDCRARVLSGEVESLWPAAPGARALRDSDEILLCQSSPKANCVIGTKAGSLGYPRPMPQFYEASVSRVVPSEEGLGWVEVRLNRPMRFLAGQFVLVEVPGVEGFRAYSPTQDGRDPFRLSFAIRIKPEGGLSPRLCSADAVGLQVNVFGPIGVGHVKPAEDGDMALVVGGSGAAVALSVIDWAYNSGHLERHRIDVVCGLRTSRCPEITSRLAAAAARFPDTLRIVIALSDEGVRGIDSPGAGTHLQFDSGMAHEVAERRLEGVWKGRAVFVAGPPPMVQSTLRMLISKARLSPEFIRYDSFS